MKQSGIKVRLATRRDHSTLVKLANTSRFTKAFSSIMFSSDEAYNKGWIRVAVDNGEIVAMSCVRHKIREPRTILYFLVVHPLHRCEKIGALMVKDMEAQTPHKRIHFSVSKDNPDARRFYERHGYRVLHGRALGGLGWEMEKSW